MALRTLTPFTAIAAVLFDLDGTLVDRDRAFAAWARSFVRDRLELADRAASDAVDLLITLDAGGYGPKAAMFRRFKEYHPDLTDQVETLVAAMRAGLVTHLSLDDDARGLLDALDLARLPWGIVTNGSVNQFSKLRAIELEARAGCVVVSEMVGARKPAPEIFRAASARLGVAPRDLLFVGDNPEADIVGAAAVGMRTAWLRRGRGWPDDLADAAPSLEIDCLSELLWLVDAAVQRTP